MGNGPSRRRRVAASTIGMYPTPPALYHPQLSGYGGTIAYPSYPEAYPTPRFPIPPQYGLNGPAGPHFYPSVVYPESLHYQYAYPPPNGYWMNAAAHMSPLGPSFETPQAPTVQRHTITVRNDVNIQKGTVTLGKDVEYPGYYLLAFSFDADSAGSFSIFLFSKEGPKYSLESLRADIYKPVHILFEKGLGQKFCQVPGTGLQLDAFDENELSKEGPDEICPLTIRAQTCCKESMDDVPSLGEGADDPLPSSVSSQITQAVILKKDNGGFDVKVLRQIIWVNGVRYELQEIYGIESVISGTELSESEFGKECVICMSEPRDTAVMPCRHMCMCDGCATLLRSKMNRCPICRQHVHALLKIKG